MSASMQWWLAKQQQQAMQPQQAQQPQQAEFGSSSPIQAGSDDAMQQVRKSFESRPEQPKPTLMQDIGSSIAHGLSNFGVGVLRGHPQLKHMGNAMRTIGEQEELNRKRQQEQLIENMKMIELINKQYEAEQDRQFREKELAETTRYHTGVLGKESKQQAKENQIEHDILEGQKLFPDMEVRPFSAMTPGQLNEHAKYSRELMKEYDSLADAYNTGSEMLKIMTEIPDLGTLFETAIYKAESDPKQGPLSGWIRRVGADFVSSARTKEEKKHLRAKIEELANYEARMATKATGAAGANARNQTQQALIRQSKLTATMTPEAARKVLGKWNEDVRFLRGNVQAIRKGNAKGFAVYPREKELKEFPEESQGSSSVIQSPAQDNPQLEAAIEAARQMYPELKNASPEEVIKFAQGQR